MVLVVKNPLANAGDRRDVGSVPGSARVPGGGNGNPFQSSCLGNPVERGAWWATVHGVAESDTAGATVHSRPSQEALRTLEASLGLSEQGVLGP